ncbi:periplasmic chaperone for outer membrane proteins Skp [Sphingobacterium allocomposti]|uniref:Periplasmic chaperone for outer membrane proteins Skp n=2 Tax=Sphingobacterium allocomposti TaxID=415956 RepID=A0A5S5DP75_9SPHI|nr:periplasmic chaperone for outer membrane proteins Skp [Sphingobacterium composti Yoo et al. 2007 non Ten et al. 2007]
MERMKNLFRSVAVAAVVVLGTQSLSAQQKIGHVNADEIFQMTPEFKTANDQLKTLNDTKTKELQGMYEEYQKKQNDANEKLRNRSEANKATVDAELQTLGQELQNIEQRIQEVQRVAQEDLGKKQQELLAPIQTKVMNAINAVAKEKGYAYVLDTSSGSVIYFQGGEDISADVKAKLGISANATPVTPAVPTN